MKLKKEEIERIVKVALNEDISSGDITSDSLEFKKNSITGSIIAKQSGILCGVEIIEYVFKEVSESNKVEILKKDGNKVFSGDVVVKIKGNPVDLLRAERTGLNFLSHLSGIATLTNRFVERANSKNPECLILDTRKTLPGLRYLQKYAVKTGGGENHRFNLSEHVLVKENHLSISNISIKEMVSSIRKKTPPNTIVEIEVENLQQLKEVIDTDTDIIMLDNFKIDDIGEAVKLIKLAKPDIRLEVSGGVTLDNVAEIADTGVDRISVGSLTNSAPVVDFTMLINSK